MGGLKSDMNTQNSQQAENLQHVIQQGQYSLDQLPWWAYAFVVVLLIAFFMLYKNKSRPMREILLPFSLIVFTLAGCSLTFFVQYESERYRQVQVHLAQSTTKGVVHALIQTIYQKRQSVDSLVKFENELLGQVLKSPNDLHRKNLLTSIIASRLPDYLSYTVAKSDGEILKNYQDPRLGNGCREDIIQFSKDPEENQNTLPLHNAGSENYHFDVITHFDTEYGDGIFFVSFKVQTILNLLQNAQIPGMSLLIVRDDNPSIIKIDVSDDGIKNTSKKLLSTDKLHSVIYQQTVPDTGWRIIALPDHQLFSDYKQLLTVRSIYAYGALAFIVIVILWRLWREEQFRYLAEQQLLELNQQLESKVLKRTEQLAESERVLYATFMSAPFGMMIIDQNGKIELLNLQAEQIFGYTEKELIGKSIESLVPERFKGKHVGDREAYQAHAETRNMGQGRHLTGLTKDGREIPVEIGLSTLGNQKNGTKVIVSISDTSELIGVYEQLTEEHERALVTLNSIMDGVVSTNTKGIVLSLNPVGEKLTGWSFEQAKGRHITEIFNVVNVTDGEKVEDPIMLCLQKESIIESDDETELLHKSGMRIPVEEQAAPIHNTEGQIIGAVLVFHDVTQSRAHAHEIEYQANHDALTGLLNRREFDARLSSTVKHLSQNSFENVLLFMDLDRFKLVNDTAGHAAGDDLLKQLTRLMSSKLRQRDTFARLGGDEFGVLLEHCSRDVGLKVANTLRQAVEDFRFFWEGQVYSVGVSIGLVFFSSDQESSDDLLSNADAACYTAKEGGRNRVHLYDLEAAKKRSESSIVNMLSEAYEKDRMLLFQQQIRATNEDDPQKHYEILIRMLGDNGEIIQPGMFLPAAERYGLAIILDRWVVKKSISWLNQYQSSFSSPPILSINLSAQSITDNLFKDFVRQLLLDNLVDGSLICFEITETAAMKNLQVAKQFIDELKGMGCRFALDDFGSGHASYAHLKNLPVDYLKIDGMFVKDITNDPINYPIVKSFNEVGQVLGMKTIAEFVENEDIIDKLNEIGVDYLQGYAISKPAPLDEILPDKLVS